MADRPGRSLMFNLGSMVGGIVRGFTTPIARAGGKGSAEGVDGGRGESGRVVRTTVREQVVETPSGPVTLRRTVVDEVVPPSRGDGSGGAG